MKDKFVAGHKFDSNKEKFALIPPSALFEVAKVFTYGANKYEPHNWEKGISYSRLFSACMRHLWKWWRGEDKDPESNISHLSHAAANIFFLLHYEYNKRKYKTFDDRSFNEKNKNT